MSFLRLSTLPPDLVRLPRMWHAVWAGRHRIVMYDNGAGLAPGSTARATAFLLQGHLATRLALPYHNGE